MYQYTGYEPQLSSLTIYSELHPSLSRGLQYCFLEAAKMTARLAQFIYPKFPQVLPVEQLKNNNILTSL